MIKYKDMGVLNSLETSLSRRTGRGVALALASVLALACSLGSIRINDALRPNLPIVPGCFPTSAVLPLTKDGNAILKDEGQLPIKVVVVEELTGPNARNKYATTVYQQLHGDSRIIFDSRQDVFRRIAFVCVNTDVAYEQGALYNQSQETSNWFWSTIGNPFINFTNRFVSPF